MHQSPCDRASLPVSRLKELALAIRTANTESWQAFQARRERNFKRSIEQRCGLLTIPEGWEDEPEFPRAWHKREQDRYPLHPAVVEACAVAAPLNWHLVVLEWPHQSQGEDRTRVAYTQDDKKGVADRQAVTSIGKYLSRHWRGVLPDDKLRDIAARYTVTGMRISDSLEDIIKAAQEGPSSCMKWDDDDIENRGAHPYEVYRPELGWSVCLHEDGYRIVGRALVWTDEDGHKCFVRSYFNPGDKSYSESDNAMEAWLEGQGVQKRSGWPEGAKLAKVRCRGTHTGFILPYLDGHTDRVHDDGDTWVIDSDGLYMCDYSDGNAEPQGVTCEDCGARVPDEDTYTIGRYNDRCVCSSCFHDGYTTVIGRRGEEYAVPDDEAVETVDGDHYHREYLSDNEIVELENGDFVKMDDAFYCPINDGWYSDEDGVYAEDREQTIHKDDAWQCYATDKWYSDDEASVEVDGEHYHPDDAPEEEEEPA